MAKAVEASETEPRIDLGADRHGEDEIAAADRAEILGSREQRRDQHARCVHPRFVMDIVEVERMRRGTVGERRAGRGQAQLAGQRRGAAGLFPAL